MASSQPGGRWIMVNNFVTNAIYWAYPSETGEYINLPDWAKTERYDVEARVDDVSGILDRESLRAPLRRLLADRFRFVAHYETRQRRIYELVRAKPSESLPRALRRLDIDCDEYMWRQKAAGTPSTTVATNGAPVCATFNTRGVLRSGGMTMSTLADVLTGIVGTRVRERTELEGAYEFTLSYDNKPLSTDPNAPSGKPGIFEALQAQLGLKLESRQAPVEVLVIDRLERPTEN